jgi:hypothetical protein
VEILERSEVRSERPVVGGPGVREIPGRSEIFSRCAPRGLEAAVMLRILRILRA